MIPSAASTQSATTVPLTEDKPDIAKALERHFSLEPLNGREQRRLNGRKQTSHRRRALYADELPPAGGALDLRKESNRGALQRMLTTNRGASTTRTVRWQWLQAATESPNAVMHQRNAASIASVVDDRA